MIKTNTFFAILEKICLYFIVLLQMSKWPKMTQNAKTRQNAYSEAGTLLHTYFKIISMHSCQETIFFCRKQRGRGGGILDNVPFWAPRAIWLNKTGTLHIQIMYPTK